MRELLVYGDKTFKIKVPDDAKITFGPWSPPTGANSGRAFGDERNRTGTLRIYKGTKDNIIACFAGVWGFRDLSLNYAEEIAVEEGATIWKSDQDGYMREDKIQRSKQWIDDDVPALPKPRRRRSPK
jgi:hypothetical protein